MDLLLPEMQRRAALADALGLHAEHAPVEFDAAVDIGDGQVQMVYALDLHGRPPRLAETKACHGAGRLASTARSCKISACCRSRKPAFSGIAGRASRDRRCAGAPHRCRCALPCMTKRSTSPVDQKPKGDPRALKRLRNILENPVAAFVADRWDEGLDPARLGHAARARRNSHARRRARPGAGAVANALPPISSDGAERTAGDRHPHRAGDQLGQSLRRMRRDKWVVARRCFSPTTRSARRAGPGAEARGFESRCRYRASTP